MKNRNFMRWRWIGLLLLAASVLMMFLLVPRYFLKNSAGAPAVRDAGDLPRTDSNSGHSPQPANPPGTVQSPASGYRRILIRASHMSDRANSAITLRPRSPLPKEPLRVPPGNAFRILVKLSDDLEARAHEDGKLVVAPLPAGALTALDTILEQEQILWQKVQSTSDEKLLALERLAAANSGVSQPDLGGLLEAKITAPTKENALRVASALQALPQVEYAELSSADAPPPPPATDVAPTTPDLSFLQTYRSTDAGIGVDYVWNTLGIRGRTDLRVTDCEYACNPDHEDLQSLVEMQPDVSSMYSIFGNDHGTAVLGILFAGNNGYGMSGSIPDCHGFFYPEYSQLSGGGTQDRAATVTKAIADSSPGDIVMLEMQVQFITIFDYVPAEYSLSVWNAVKVATDAGIIVVAAAGNGAKNLDTQAFSDYRKRGDSGAILVGAGDAGRARISFSTYGSRVNLQGWGGGVATLGYGYYAKYGGDPNQEYTASFDGTSSATPIVTSAVALLQSVAIKNYGMRLTPAEMRNLLVSTGRRQTGDLTSPIGPLPCLADAVAALAAPIVIRDQPQGFRLKKGAACYLTVKAGSREALRYQWKKDGKELPGEVKENFVIHSATDSDAGTYTVVVSTTNATVTSLPAILLPANPYAQVAGSYVGLAGDGTLGSGSAEDRQAFFATNGLLSIKTKKDGGFTGFFRIEGKRYPLSGKFDGVGQATLTIKRAGKPDVVLSLRFDTGLPGKITGTASLGGAPAPVRALPGERMVFPPGDQPTSSTLTILLPAPDSSLGHGFATLKVTAKGSAVLSGKLADGTPFTAATQAVDDGPDNWSLPVQVPLYSGSSGMIFGELLLEKNIAGVTGNLGWLRPISAKTTLFPNGFLKALVPAGKPWQPAKDISILSGTSDSASFSLTFDPPGNLITTSLSQNGVWPKSNIPSFTKPLNIGQRFHFSQTSGVFHGSFPTGLGSGPAGTRYEGVMFNNPLTLPGIPVPISGGGYFTTSNASAPVQITAPSK